MKQTILTTIAALVLCGNNASAEITETQISTHLRELGFSNITIRDRGNHIAASGLREDGTLEVIWDTDTGALLAQDFERAPRIGLRFWDVDMDPVDTVDIEDDNKMWAELERDHDALQDESAKIEKRRALLKDNDGDLDEEDKAKDHNDRGDDDGDENADDNENS